MNVERRIAVNTASQFTAQLVVMTVGFFLAPFLLDTLGETVLGLRVLVGQVMEYAMLLSGAFAVSYARHAMIHYARKEFDQMNAVLWAGLLLTVASIVVVIVATVCLVIFTGELLGVPPEFIRLGRIVVLIVGAGTALGMSFRVWESPTFITERFYLSNIARIFACLSAAGGVVILFHLHEPSIVTWVLLVIGTGLIARLIFVIPFCRRALPQMKIRPATISRQQFKQIVSFSGYSLIGSLSYLLYYSTDVLIISHLDELGLSMAYLYDLGQRWDPNIRRLVMAFAMMLTPMMTGMVAVKNYDGLGRVLLKGTRYCLLLGLFPCLFLAFFAEPFIRCWLSLRFDPQEIQKYLLETVPVLRWIVCGVILTIPGMIGYQALIALGKIRQIALVTLFLGIVNIILSIVFVKYFGLGLLGVALGTVLTLTIKHAIYSPYVVSHYVGLSLSRYFREGYGRAMVAALPMVAVCLVLRWTWQPGDILVLLAQLGICGVAYAGGVWMIGLTDDDRTKARAVTRKAWAWTRNAVSRGKTS